MLSECIVENEMFVSPWKKSFYVEKKKENS